MKCAPFCWYDAPPTRKQDRKTTAGWLSTAQGSDVSDYLAGTRRTELAPLLLTCFWGGDLVGRLEAHEFGVLLYCPLKAVEVAVARMERAVQRFNADRPIDRHVSLMVAHASYDEARHKSLEDLIAEAAAGR